MFRQFYYITLLILSNLTVYRPVVGLSPNDVLYKLLIVIIEEVLLVLTLHCFCSGVISEVRKCSHYILVISLNTVLAINNVDTNHFWIICWKSLTLACELLIMWHWWVSVVIPSLKQKLYVVNFNYSSSEHLYAMLLSCTSWEYFLWHDFSIFRWVCILRKIKLEAKYSWNTRKLGTNASFFNSILS